jgi:hypothetical protein
VHKHKWDYRSGVGRTGAFRCLGCRALVSLLVCPVGLGGFSFTLRVVLPGLGVSAAQLDAIGDFCRRTVGQPSAVYVEVAEVRHKRAA